MIGLSSLLDVAYKSLASTLRMRLIAASAEGRLSEGQFGFRSGFSTQDAIFVLRRKIETAWAQKNGCLYVLALDWAKAFDSLDPEAMLDALRRFGLPSKILNLVRAIYTDRRFKVQDSSHLSSERAQNSGISHGCPLSPFLFVMVMTVVLEDAVRELSADDQQLRLSGLLSELLYADDTLILSVSAKPLERYLAAISTVGRRYGLVLHWGKLQLLAIRGHDVVRRPDGSKISADEEMTYLGATVTSDGRTGRELTRRVGMAKRSFLELSRVWTHSALGRKRRTEIFNALISTKLMYGLTTTVMPAADRSRLDAFQSYCLRKIWGVLPSYISRVSNVQVLQKASQKPLSEQMTLQQLLLFGKAARAPPGSIFRDCAFCPGSLRSAADRFVRRVGRPRLEWITHVQNTLLKVTASMKMPSATRSHGRRSAWSAPTIFDV